MNNIDTIIHQKSVADLVLKQLFTIDPFSIVAGGAPRDWYLGKPATDIDAFFYDSRNYTFKTMKQILESAGFKITQIKLGDKIPELYKKNPNLKGVFEAEIKGVKVQLMHMSKPTFDCVLPNFPLSLCHIWYKSGKIVAEKPFLRSIKHKAIYKTSQIYNNEHQYVNKILDKFPEYKYYESVEKFSEAVIDNV